jgi:hypothetical protein
VDGAKPQELALPCLFCGDPVPLSDPSVTCSKPDCKEKEADAWNALDY